MTEHRGYRKDVTDAEIERFMAGSRAVHSLMRSVVVQEAVQGETPAEQKPPPEPSEPAKRETLKRNDKAQSDLLEDARSYLLSVFDHPNLTMTGRNKDLGWSTDKANSIKNTLIEKGVVHPFTINAGRSAGGTVKLLELTQIGAQALKVELPFVRKGRVSAEHWWWQLQIYEHFRSEGFEAEIEKQIDGQRADVGVLKDGRWIAYEVAISPQNEIRNIQKDLAAGFSFVAVCCRDVPVRNAVTSMVREHASPEHQAKTKIALLSNFSFVRKIFKPAQKAHGTSNQLVLR